MTPEDVLRLKQRKAMIACFGDDELACAALEETVVLAERIRKIKYGRWLNEGGCRLRRVEPPELNRHPVFLMGWWGMDFSSFVARDQCDRGSGIIVMSYGYGSEKFLIDTLKPRNYWRGVLLSESNVAGFRRLVVISNNSRFTGDGDYRKLFLRKTSEALYGAAVDADYAATLFATGAVVNARSQSDSSAKAAPVQAT
jgi:hypothetical protein